MIALALACDRPPGSADSPPPDTGSTVSKPDSVVAPASAIPAEPAEPARPADLDASRSAFSRAFTGGDSTAFHTLFVSDGPVIDMAGMDPEPLQGSSGVRLFTRRVASLEAKTGPRFTPDTVQLDNGTARESGRWSWSPGKQKAQGTYRIAWRRDADGRWRIAEYRFMLR